MKTLEQCSSVPRARNSMTLSMEGMDSDFMPQGGVPKEYYIPLGNGNRSRLKRVGEKKARG
jgi:hypothetical protein